jgi:3-deoxy-D-manno-octulosonic-acid transferase
MENFREAESVLLENEGAVRVSTAEELEQTLRKWLNNPRLCHALGENALKALQSRQGATGRNAELISGYLDQEA